MFDEDTVDLKKETISSLLYKAGFKASKLPTWIKIFQDNVYGFSEFLKGKILIVKSDLIKLNESNLKNFIEYANQDINCNYVLIKRHYALFSLFSELVLQLSSMDYSSEEGILLALAQKKITGIIECIDICYKELIENVDTETKFTIGLIDQTQYEKIEEKISEANKIMYRYICSK